MRVLFLLLFIGLIGVARAAPPITLTSADELKAAELYRTEIATNVAFSASDLEKLERQVNAKRAYDERRWWDARYDLRRVLKDNPQDFQAWLFLGEVLKTFPSQADIVKAFTNALALAPTQSDKAVVLWVAAASLQEEALRLEALKLASPADIAEHQKQIAVYPKAFAPYFLDLPVRSETAMACFTWTRPLVKERNFHYEEYVTVAPAVADQAVVVKGNQLCVEGLTFGQRYHFTFKAGFPGEEDKLQEARVIDVIIPHRPALVQFRERGYLLPTFGPQIIPLRVVNAPAVKVTLFHVPERNIQVIRESWFANRFYNWEVDQISREKGEKIWEGTYQCSQETDKNEICGLSVPAMVGKKLEPGVYVISANNADSFSSQALIISDIGLSTQTGPAGLFIQARSLSTGAPLANVQVTLIARDNRQLTKVLTNPAGQAQIAAALLNGQGGKQVAFLEAVLPEGQFTILNLQDTALDLSDRGASGRDTSSPVNAYVTTERGIYRPGEQVNILALLRDQKGRALEKIPLTFKLFRPDGVQVYEQRIQESAAGGYSLPYNLAGSAFTGMWTASVALAPNTPTVGQVLFEVNDFVPSRIEVTSALKQPILEIGKPDPLTVHAQYYFGPPGRELKVQTNATLQIADRFFPVFGDYYFGLEEESWTVERFNYPPTMTNQEGQAQVSLALEKSPQTTHLLQLETQISVLEIGGRARTIKRVDPVWHQPYVLGVAPSFKDRSVASSDAGFQVIALDKEGKRLSKSDLRYTLFEEEQDYVWYQTNSGWQYEAVTQDRVIKSALFSVSEEENPTALSFNLKPGRYRIEVLDEKTGVATSFRFCSGWAYQATSPDKPDKVDVKWIGFKEGKATLAIESPFSGKLNLKLAGQTLQTLYEGNIEKGHTTLNVALAETAVQTVDNHIIATVYRPAQLNLAQMPNHAIGIAYVQALKHAEQILPITLQVPKITPSQHTLEVAVQLPARKGAHVAVALVDEGILSLKGRGNPTPITYFFSQPQLAYLLRDNYGFLINPFGVRAASFEVGGGHQAQAANRALSVLPARPFEMVSLFSGIIPTQGQSTIKVPFEIPAFSGKLQVMVWAWDESAIGYAKTDFIVRDKVDISLQLPRFLAPFDKAAIPLVIQNNDSPEGNYTVLAQLPDSTVKIPLALLVNQEQRIPLEVKVGKTQLLPFDITLEGPQNFTEQRRFELSVRSGIQARAKRQYGILAAGESLTLTQAALEGLAGVNPQLDLEVGAVPQWGIEQLIKEILAYSYGGLDQIVSRFIALSEPQKSAAFNELLTLQKLDGSFGNWSPIGRAEPWLTLYAADILGEQASTTLKEWIQRFTAAPVQPDQIDALAYAYYLLARESKAQIENFHYFVSQQEKQITSCSAQAFVGAAFAYYADEAHANAWFDKAIANTKDVHWLQRRDFGSVLRDRALLVVLLSKTMDSTKGLEVAAQVSSQLNGREGLSAQEKVWLIRAYRALAEKNTTHLYKSFTLDALAQPQVITNTDKAPWYYAQTAFGEPRDISTLVQKGFSLTRGMYQLTGEPIDKQAFVQGERYIVVLKGKVLVEGLRNFMLVDPLPAGFEIEVTPMGNLQQQFSWLGTLTPAARVDARDDRFFVAYEQGETNFITAYMVRAVTKGQFAYPPSYVEAIYQPNYFQYGISERIQIIPAIS